MKRLRVLATHLFGPDDPETRAISKRLDEAYGRRGIISMPDVDVAIDVTEMAPQGLPAPLSLEEGARETSEKLDHTLRAYGRQELRMAELKRAFVKVCEQRNDAQAERNRLVEAMKGIWDLAHIIVLNTEDAQARHQEIADAAERALVEAGVLTPRPASEEGRRPMSAEAGS